MRLVSALTFALGGSALTCLVAFVLYLENIPDLSVWHTAVLDEEFTADSGLATFEDYLLLEDRLFAQLDEEVYAKISPEDQTDINRYHRGSHSDASDWPTNWNRSFELPHDDPQAGVLLLHGLSDSPYSLHSIAKDLSANGAWVLGLRIPGHGTAPSGLVHTSWQDMQSAVHLAARYLSGQIDQTEVPLHIVGYSNGGALGLLYALESLADDSLPQLDGLVLISPEIGISKFASLAVWQSRLGRLLGLQKLQWKSVTPEYDPYKYGSFAINAGDQAYRLTIEVQVRITEVGNRGALDRIPPILAFQSVVDATVSAPALIEHLFQRLPPGDHEVVLFDVNQHAVVGPLMTATSRDTLTALLVGKNLDFKLTIITNQSEESDAIVARSYAAGDKVFTEKGLTQTWPTEVYSLSHVALPFPTDDPLYGTDHIPDYEGIRLGNVSLRGERGVLRVDPSGFLRLRSNPFYSYLEVRTRDFVNARSAPTG